MNKKIRWAILGAGKIAHSFANDFAEVENAELVAIASGNSVRAKMFATQYNLPIIYTYDELYSSNEVDAVYIATTHNFHYEQCLRCIESGKSVLCEKPITLNDKQFKKLAALAGAQKVFLMEAMWTWLLPAVIKAMDWYKEGKIGELKMIEANFGFPMEKNLEGRLYNMNLAGGALLDLGVYPVALATLFSGVHPIKITTDAVLTETGVDERTGMILQYENVSATLFTSMVNIMTNKAVLYGTKGYIEIPDFFKATSAKRFDTFHNELENFIDDRTTKGYNFEAQHATDLILAGKIESDIITHNLTNIVQEIMTEVRRKIGVTYPGE